MISYKKICDEAENNIKEFLNTDKQEELMGNLLTIENSLKLMIDACVGFIKDTKGDEVANKLTELRK